MTLQDEVLDDLLTLYLAGEASEPSRRLVEDYLARRPDKASAARAAGNAMLPVAADPPPDMELQALERTRKLVSRRQSFFGMGLFFTLLPGTFTFGDGRVQFSVLRDGPIVAAVWLCVAIAMWIGFARTSRDLHATGLQRPAWWPVWGTLMTVPLALSVWFW